ncbi:transposase [Vibrio sp. 1863]|uniref:IS66 family transposase n=1 Tax=Vibrio sp. 1863 TaxID=3074579 RepID=UPI0029650F2E|nr:transposase [Vibrio sp. 1863]MDW2077920.1 transposase [Vibrio sp. 1863]
MIITFFYEAYKAILLRNTGCHMLLYMQRKACFFIEAQAAQPKGKKAKVSNADTALGHINQLYHIERQINELKEKVGYTPEQVVAYRQEHSVPLLDKLKIFLENNGVLGIFPSKKT